MAPITDQYLPPGTPGYEDIDVYPAHPDIELARDLAGWHPGGSAAPAHRLLPDEHRGQQHRAAPERSAAAQGTTTIPITVRLSSEMDNAVSVDYATADGTAHAGEDYVATSGTLTFAAHERAKTVDVTVLADQAADGDETFTLNLSNESSGTMVDNQAVVTILAPHPPPPPPPFTPPKCVVPNVLHLKLAKAKARIRARHCRIGKVSKRHFRA